MLRYRNNYSQSLILREKEIGEKSMGIDEMMEEIALNFQQTGY
jgi:hypothetical protein